MSEKRLLFLPPGVQKGKEKMPKCEDFICFETKPLGQGAFGEVFKVRHKVSNKDFAIKVIKKRKIIERCMLPQLRREIRIMYSLRHPNIISLYSHFEDSENFYLILEYAPGGQLYSRLKKYKTIPESAAAQYMREVCLAIQYLHSRIPPIIHRDIKPENILISADDSVKLGDFGWSNFLDDERDTYCGTLEYLAPEMVERRGHGVSLDIWSLGVLLFELLSGHSPFKARSQLEMFDKIKVGKIVFPKAFPILAKDLVKKMIVVNPDRRLSAELVLDHAWILSHAPLRPTVELVRIKVELPSAPDEGDVEFFESNYVVVSAPKGKDKKTKINEEYDRKLEHLNKLKEKIEICKRFSEEIDSSVISLKKEHSEHLAVSEKIEAARKRINEIKYRHTLINKRYLSKLAEIKLVKKKKKIAEKKIVKIRNDIRTKELKLSLCRQSRNYLVKLNCFQLLKHKLDTLSYTVSLICKSFKNLSYLPLAKQHLKSFDPEEHLKSEIEKFIPEFKKIFTDRSKSLKVLSRKLKDLKNTSVLQSQILQTIRPRMYLNL